MRRLKIVLLVSFGIACSKPGGGGDAPRGSEPAVTAPPAPAVSTAPVAASAAPAAAAPDREMLVSEEEFKKLHELKTAAAPAARGVSVKVDGQSHYLGLPSNAKAPLPGLVVIHEWWGLNEHVKHYADRLAGEGYAALAVDLYQGKVAATPDDAMKSMKAVEPAAATKTLLSAHRFLASDARVRADRTGSIGWCFGGKWSLELALAAPELDAVVVYYGHVTTDAERLKALKAPLLGIFANRDKAIPPATVDQFEQALKPAGASVKILRYDADHAFANPSGERYDAKAAASAWNETRAFLARHLRGG